MSKSDPFKKFKKDCPLVSEYGELCFYHQTPHICELDTCPRLHGATADGYDKHPRLRGIGLYD